ncbi:MAG: LTA synthase family protein [Streptococcaceae bacterium]|jgi:lipoteichoic acid synthase|nr:LTA synthase family protein [Streptococcaceae bacterium]
MENKIDRILSSINTRIGFVWWLALFLWFKTLIAYFAVFNGLGVDGIIDTLMIFINPLGFTITVFSLTLFFKRTGLFYTAIGILAFIGTLILFANINYYREFNDFLTINSIVGGAQMFGNGGIGANSVPTNIWDIIYWLDLLIIVILFIARRLHFDKRPVEKKRAFSAFSFALMLFGLTFWAADLIKPQMIMRRAQSDKTYVVRYLGLGPWLLTNGYYSHVANEQRANAKLQTFQQVQEYIKKDRYLASNVSFDQSLGLTKRNVIVIHLESFQQFLMGLKITGSDGKEYEVTPFLNSIYRSKETYSFNNFFSQIGGGKTSDAETLLETSTFGLPSDNFLQTFGPTQTLQAMPAVLAQSQGYSSAVFHGNRGSFYERIKSYKSMGYQNFFDQSFFDKNSATLANTYGIKDKIIFRDSVPYLEQLQQPFYVKYLTVSNHLPYKIAKEDEDPNFKTVETGNKAVDNYFLTTHYLDQAVKQFYDYLKDSGLYNKSIIVLYGDHYGVNNENSPDLSSVFENNPTASLHFTKDEYDTYDWTQLQKTPFMINIPGNTNGHEISTFTGEIDVMPTIEHLLGINTSNYIQFGQDMFASGRQEWVALRNGGFISPSITLPSLNSKVIYDTNTGLPITEPTADQEKYVKETKAKVTKMLKMSDELNNQNLLQFYTPEGFKPIKPTDYDYNFANTLKRLAAQQKSLGAGSTSLWSQRGDKTSWDLYTTDIPEVKNGQDDPKYVPKK